MIHRLPRFVLLSAVLLPLVVLGPVVATLAEDSETTGASPELNRRFVDPELDVEAWIGRFEVESREVFAARNEILRASGVSAGARVADVGAGTGLYTRLFAEAAGSGGWVFAVDIGPRFLEHINRKTAELNLGNVTTILGRTDSVALPPDAVDLVFVCDTYHHFEDPRAMLASIRRTLVPGGTLIIVDFERIPGESREWVLDHVRAGKEVFRAEIEAAGFTFVEEVAISGLKENYLLRFHKK